MLDTPLKYQLRSSEKHKDKESHHPDITQVYIAFHHGNKIHIRVEQYDYIQFIKFFPHSLRDSNNKYKRRVFYKKNPNKIFSTCVQIAVDKLKENSEAIIGVHGSWDDTDVAKENKTSDRYELWFNFAVSVFDSEKFAFIRVPQANSFFLMKKEFDNPETKAKINEFLSERFSDVVDSLMIPKNNKNLKV